MARTVTVKVRYPDFRIITRSRTLPSDACEAGELLTTATALAFDTPRPPGPIRLLGVIASNLRPREAHATQPRLPFPS